MQSTSEWAAKNKLYSWRIYRVWGTTTAYLGIVDAALDEESAVKIAIGKFQITNSEHQKRLRAERRDEPKQSFKRPLRVS